MRPVASQVTLFLVAASISGCAGVDDGDLSSVESAVTQGEDLVVTAVDDPPPTASVGQTISIGDTTENIGTFTAGASFTKHYLSSNGITPQYRLGARQNGAIPPGGFDAGTTDGTIAPGTPFGTYFVIACADRGGGTQGNVSEVEETNESNNCLTSTGQVTITAPDLTASNVSIAQTSIDRLTGTLTVTDTINNIGNADATQSSTRWYLSTDNVRNTNDAFIRNCIDGNPIPGRTIAMIPAGSSSTGAASATPLCVRDSAGLHPATIGTYWVISCADEGRTVGEGNENNNCAASAGSVLLTECGNGAIEGPEACDDGNVTSGDGCSSTCGVESGPDLTTTSVTNPPATVNAGGSFPVTDNVQNIGSANSGTSITRYFLSTDTVRDAGDFLLNNARNVPNIAPGGNNMAGITVVVPAGTPAGTYFLIACADFANTVVEASEANNCIASATTTTTGGADLQVTAISNPPATIGVGGTFLASSTTRNNGPGSAPATHTQFYLSSNGTTVGAYLATRAIPPLASGAQNAGTTTLTFNTPGTWYIIACADRGNGPAVTPVVTESNETNNCLASTTTVTVTQPDLTITAATTDAPPTANRGATFNITETTQNIGNGAAGAFFNRYYLVAPGVPSWYLGNARPIAGLAAGATDSATFLVQVRSATALGTYTIVACADRGNAGGSISQIAESNESNNCLSTGQTITIQ